MRCLKILTVGLVVCALSGYAQEIEESINENSVRPIHEQNQMYKKRIWRWMDLREKQNEPYFATGFEISGFIIDRVKNGELIPYETNDSLNKRLTKEEFLSRIEMEDVGGGDDFGGGFGGGGGWGDTGGGWGDDTGAEAGAEPEPEVAGPDYFLPSNIAIMEIMEDMIFDRKRSRMYYDIQSITLIIPAEQFATGIFRKVATFKYKDLHELFKEYPDKAIWFNRQNTAQHRNFADAFDLRLFSAHITKFSNPKDNNITDIYANGDTKIGIQASQWVEYEMLNYESGLWEY